VSPPHEPSSSCAAGVGRFVAVILILGPVAGERIDAKSELRPVGARPKALVEASDRGTGTVGKTGQLAAGVGGCAVPDVQDVVPLGPLEGGLQVESLPSSLLVIRGDAFDGSERRSSDRWGSPAYGARVSEVMKPRGIMPYLTQPDGRLSSSLA
jgi:hypothetical protein